MQDQLLEAGKEWEHLTDQEQDGKTEHKRPGTEEHKNKEEKKKRKEKGSMNSVGSIRVRDQVKGEKGIHKKENKLIKI